MINMYEWLNLQLVLIGELMFVIKKFGDEVFLGFICKQGEIEVVVIVIGVYIFFGKVVYFVDFINNIGYFQKVNMFYFVVCFYGISLFFFFGMNFQFFNNYRKIYLIFGY